MASEPLLFHFSEEPDIPEFVPRAVGVGRAPGREWLNSPLVWAIDAWHSPCYVFPRDCPRILWWPLESTSQGDLDRHWGDRDARMVACIEWAWFERLTATTLYRYALPGAGFVSLEDHGVHVNRQPVRPASVEPVSDLVGALREAGVELRIMSSLLPLRGMWATTLHVSGMRLRNAAGWE